MEYNMNELDEKILVKACYEGNNSKIKELLKSKPEVINQKTSFEVSLLHFAVLYGHLEITKILLDMGGDIKDKDVHMGHTLLHKAVMKGHINIIRLLIEYGADINTKDNGGYTPLYVAKQFEQIRKVEESTNKNHFMLTNVPFDPSNLQYIKKFQKIIGTKLKEVPLSPSSTYKEIQTILKLADATE
jgi:ankyrin repeat protein